MAKSKKRDKTKMQLERKKSVTSLDNFGKPTDTSELILKGCKTSQLSKSPKKVIKTIYTKRIVPDLLKLISTLF